LNSIQAISDSRVEPVAGPFDLTGRVALVTGGSRGLGRAMVQGLAEAGADVIIASRKLEECERAAREIESKTGRRALAACCHVGHWHEVDALVDQAYSAFDRVDILVNNAGMSPLYDRPSEITEELWDKVFSVNLKGAFRLSALVGERMREAGRGSIISISSAGSEYPRGDIIPYAAAKAGLNAMSEAFAYAYGPNVRSNVIMAGPFLTDISKAWDMEAFEAMAQRFALKRGGRPEEIVGAVLYLASDASSFTTGAILRVDGGYTA
jgi:NAD(P)-dependent dehydrogenase (short-subunit alcohol dehydrogenase family)